jgi:hypothetical protein
LTDIRWLQWSNDTIAPRYRFVGNQSAGTDPIR